LSSPASALQPASTGAALGQSLLSALPSLATTALSAFTQFQSARAQQQTGRFQQQQLQLQSRAQDLATRQQALRIRENAIKNAARARALFAGRGIARTGSAARAITKSFSVAGEDIEQLNIQNDLKQAGISFESNISGIQSRLQGVNRLINLGQRTQKSLLSIF